MIPFGLNPLGVDIATEETDLDILRAIRDANPDSQLPALWLDSEDPYTQWEGVIWDNNKVISLTLDFYGISTLVNVNKLTFLFHLSCTGNSLTELDLLGLKLHGLFCSNNQIVNINYNGYLIGQFSCDCNLLTELSFITSYDEFGVYNFTYNTILESELNRLRSLGYTDSQLLPQNQ